MALVPVCQLLEAEIVLLPIDEALLSKGIGIFGGFILKDLQLALLP